MLKREEFLGFNFTVSNNLKQTAYEIMTYSPTLSLSHIPIVLTLNVDYVVKLNQQSNQELIHRLRKSAFIFSDGQPIVWAAKYYKKNIKHRITGSDLFPEMYELAKKQNTKILLISPGKATSDYYRKDHPDACIYDLPFIDNEDVNTFIAVISDCVDIIVKNGVKVVFIGVSFPKQDRIALGIYDSLKERNYLHMPTLALLGASLEFTAGVKKRAPRIYQKLGMEWFYREPRRLFKRYFIESFKFISILKSFEGNKKEENVVLTEPVKQNQLMKHYSIQHQSVPNIREQHVSSLSMKTPSESHKVY
jgi:N-acetylglucosaminyldiphosphoundecaprenol N-acetyl-beta-D-mannosaminyltransferase